MQTANGFGVRAPKPFFDGSFRLALDELDDLSVALVGKGQSVREQGLALGAVLSSELLILQGADVDEHVEPCALDTGLEGQERNAQVARGGVVEAAQQGLCKRQGPRR